MERIEIIGKQIQYVNDLRTIVHTMKIYSAVKIRQYEKAVSSLSEYFRTVELGLQIVYQDRLNHLPDLPRDREHRTGIIVFGSGQPFCGSFDDQLASFVYETLVEEDINNPAVFTIGERIGDSLSPFHLKTDRYLEVPGTLSGINELTFKLLDGVASWREQEEIRQIILFHNKPGAQAGFTSRKQRLLPLDNHWLKHISERPWPTNNRPIYPPQADTIIASLINHYLFVSIYRAAAESQTAEYGSRLASMQSAEKKIRKHLGLLNNEYRQIRQTAVTDELLDIISGFEVAMHEE